MTQEDIKVIQPELLGSSAYEGSYMVFNGVSPTVRMIPAIHVSHSLWVLGYNIRVSSMAGVPMHLKLYQQYTAETTGGSSKNRLGEMLDRSEFSEWRLSTLADMSSHLMRVLQAAKVKDEMLFPTVLVYHLDDTIFEDEWGLGAFSRLVNQFIQFPEHPLLITLPYVEDDEKFALLEALFDFKGVSKFTASCTDRKVFLLQTKGVNLPSLTEVK